MIFKTLSRGKDNSDIWNYYDNAYNVSVQFDRDIGHPVVSLSTESMGAPLKFIVPDCAYILSDKGFIIDRISSVPCNEETEDKTGVPNEVH